MRNGELKLLPEPLRAESISNREIVLPVSLALEAINFLESREIAILGWEGWIRNEAGETTHDLSIQGTTSLEGYEIGEAADICRHTIKSDAEDWEKRNANSHWKLYICITTDAQQ